MEESSSHVECLPDEFEWFSDQIAGHHPTVYRNGKREIGIMKKKGTDKVWKVAQDGKRGICEISVYRLIKGDKGQDSLDEETHPDQFWRGVRREDCDKLSKLVPEYHGREKLLVDGGEHDFLVFSDVTIDYKKPAILDLKMGLVTYDPAATDKKKAREISRYPPQAKIGFKISGYRIHRNGEVTVRKKTWGLAFDESNVVEGLKEFFESGRDASSVAELKQEAIEKVEKVLSFFEEQTSFQFFASSLLFLYETDENLPANLQIFMIDFSHVFPANNNRDENYLPGLRNLHSYLKSL